MEVSDQAQLLKSLWQERNERGLLPVLDKMNKLLDEGVISAADFQKVMAGDISSAPAKEGWRRIKDITKMRERSSSLSSSSSAAELRERLNKPMSNPKR